MDIFGTQLGKKVWRMKHSQGPSNARETASDRLLNFDTEQQDSKKLRATKDEILWSQDRSLLKETCTQSEHNV